MLIGVTGRSIPACSKVPELPILIPSARCLMRVSRNLAKSRSEEQAAESIRTPAGDSNIAAFFRWQNVDKSSCASKWSILSIWNRC